MFSSPSSHFHSSRSFEGQQTVKSALLPENQAQQGSQQDLLSLIEVGGAANFDSMKGGQTFIILMFDGQTVKSALLPENQAL